MAFTLLEKLMMGSRSGFIYPGILLHLLRHCDYTVDKFDSLLNRKSGLLGVSGVSNDIRQIVTAINQGNKQAQLALDVYMNLSH